MAVWSMRSGQGRVLKFQHVASCRVKAPVVHKFIHGNGYLLLRTQTLVCSIDRQACCLCHFFQHNQCLQAFGSKQKALAASHLRLSNSLLRFAADSKSSCSTASCSASSSWRTWPASSFHYVHTSDVMLTFLCQGTKQQCIHRDDSYLWKVGYVVVYQQCTADALHT